MPSSTMWVSLEGIMLRNKSDRERQILYDTTYMWNLKIKAAEGAYQNRDRLTDIEKKSVVTSVDRKGERGKMRAGGKEVQATAMCSKQQRDPVQRWGL